jgi:PKD repeat protein
MKRLLPVIALLFVLSCTQKDVAPKPVADFNYEESTVGYVEFTSTSKNATRYQWDFGNGRVSTNPYETIQYDSNGQYTVTLTAKNEDGAMDQVKKNVNVRSVPTTGNIVFWTNFDAGNIDVKISNVLVGTTTVYVNSTGLPACFTPGLVTVTLPKALIPIRLKTGPSFL